ncbi:CopG family transcriptional regulator [candidate division KSB1 bacterium]|nr:MAG: CopG family transcriptional regulator [candidate division KSB1 bacterium]
MEHPQIPSDNRRIGVIAIIINDPDCAFDALNKILHDYSHIIIGRLGLPYRERHLSIISLIVDGSTDEVGAMTGRLGQLSKVTVKSAFAKNPTAPGTALPTK